jgi:transcription initiation factor IIE alpha subunit
MSQASVYRILSQNKGRKFTAKELALKLNLSPASIAKNLSGIRKDKEIDFERRKTATQYEYLYWHNNKEVK